MTSNYSNHWYNQHTKNHKLKPILAYLNKLLPSTCNWFIAGGSVANPNVFNDIDVFFTDKSSFNQAALAFGTTKAPYTKTPNAFTFTSIPISIGLFSGSSDYTFQLIQKQFTSIDNTLDTFDLSCSKLAIDPLGNVWKHHDYSDLIRVHHINLHTFKRIIKYVYSKNFTLDYDALQQTFTQLHSMRNSKLVDYYDNRKAVHVVKHCMLRGWVDPLFLEPLVDYIETLPSRSRMAIYDRHLSNPDPWEFDGPTLFSDPENRSLEFQRHYSLCIKRIPAMVDQFPEDYL